ncbi:MAG TPA: hypothetical protein VK923_15540 [Euzebyales bacterium]|nr:hypothetical protein [Euzebyales bacterium]
MPWILAPGLLVVLVLAAAVLLLSDGEVRRLVPVPLTSTTTFDVTVHVADVVEMDNDGVFGRRPPVADDAVVDAAARDIATVVTRYLDAEFVATETRFTDDPLPALLSDRALAVSRSTDRAGLGVVDVAVREVEPQQVRLTARMVTSGGEVVLAAVRYDARARLVTADGASDELHQRARMAFVSQGSGWRADVVEADLTLPTGEAER